MQNWLLRQNSFTKLTATGTAASAVTGMIALAIFLITFIAVFTGGQRSPFGIKYPPGLDKIAEAALFVVIVSTIGFLISLAGLITSLFAGTKPGQKKEAP